MISAPSCFLGALESHYHLLGGLLLLGWLSSRQIPAQEGLSFGRLFMASDFNAEPLGFFMSTNLASIGFDSEAEGEATMTDPTQDHAGLTTLLPRAAISQVWPNHAAPDARGRGHAGGRAFI